MERLVKFKVLGQEYPLNTDAPEAEVKEILDLVKSQLEVQSKSSKLLHVRQAILVSLNMAGKYVRLRREHDIQKQVFQQKLNSLIEKLEKV